ncbi:G-alpha-domain-containing protein [Athelia psychrophila]|uniref:G-alpha-domain-containing protein n=1 Tax=Athelia psychrophila TaxID=1759441 RepID=A0A166RBK2_9AGAM|nr:G-alpha-domain-containing protein [Fibularhizoctonia sp. CBS 109695]
MPDRIIRRLAGPSTEPRTQTGAIWPPRPPREETEEQRMARVAEETEMQRRSERIDLEIGRERAERQKKPKPSATIMLLGQAESGKSTILKNFILHYSPTSFYSERETWKSIIHLNLVRSVNFVLDLLEDPVPKRTTSASTRPPSQPKTPGPYSTNHLRALKMRLAPLRHIEITLNRIICAPEIREGAMRYKMDRAAEVSVSAGSGWKALLKLRRDRRDSRASDELVNTQRVVEACKDDIILLWQDSTIQDGLRRHKVVLEDQSGFFLSDAARIAVRDYMPTADDILRARVQTLGPEEHYVVMEAPVTDRLRGETWLFFDVGGSRAQRAAWAPYFDDANAIIFVVSMAVFDQTLAEDPSLNRLTDSLFIWKEICRNKLLTEKQFILLLNKKDILASKLRHGIQFSDYFPHYAGPNDHKNVSNRK